MKIALESTDQTVTMDGVSVRVWNGKTERGVLCKVFVHRIAVRDNDDSSEFERELAETLPPAQIIGLRQVL